MGLQKLCSDIVNEKFPIGSCPFLPHAIFIPCDPVKTDTMSGNKVEFFPQIGKRCLGTDSPDDATHVEELGCALEERIVICIETKSFVTEETANVEEITCAAAEIENLKRRCAIEPKVLHVFDVYAHPVGCVFVSVDSSRVGPI